MGTARHDRQEVPSPGPSLTPFGVRKSPLDPVADTPTSPPSTVAIRQVGKNIAKGINEGRIRFADKHLSMFPQVRIALFSSSS